MKGKVVLIGAGPGDAGLITVKGREALFNADVVIYDRLVGKDILNLIPKGAEKINAGKESSNHLIPQEEINKILVQKALEGKNVVRLKGGDSFLFGRGGEELEAVCEKGIDFEVVPGVTSALAVPCYAGIPVTHRDYTSSVHIFTGHLKNGKKLDIDFESCIRFNGTLVFLMGLTALEYIMDGLASVGMNKNMPCAVIEHGTKSNQRKFVSCISDIARICKSENVKSPAIIVVGEVCRLSESFDWFGRLPLKNKKVVVTRPAERQEALSNLLKEKGAEVIEYPCIDIVSTLDDKKFDGIVKKIGGFDWVVFTSPAGVDIFFRKMTEKRIDARIFSRCRIAGVGGGTAKELEKYNIFCDLIPEKYYVKCLGEKLAQAAKPDEKIIILRAENGSSELTDGLDSGNLYYEDTHIYKTVFKNIENLDLIERINSCNIDFVTFTSASSVDAFMSNAKISTNGFIGVCIGQKTAEAAEKYGINYIVSDEISIYGLVKKIIEVA